MRGSGFLRVLGVCAECQQCGGASKNCKSNYHMIQQLRFYVHAPKNRRQRLEEILAHPCSQQHYSQ